MFIIDIKIIVDTHSYDQQMSLASKSSCASHNLIIEPHWQTLIEENIWKKLIEIQGDIWNIRGILISTEINCWGHQTTQWKNNQSECYVRGNYFIFSSLFRWSFNWIGLPGTKKSWNACWQKSWKVKMTASLRATFSRPAICVLWKGDWTVSNMREWW